MEIYYRYFKVPMDSPVAVRMAEIMDVHDQIKDHLEQIKTEVGATKVLQRRNDSQFYGFVFSPPIDHPDWRKPCREYKSQAPRSTTKAGKELWRRIQEAPAGENIYNCLTVVGLACHALNGLCSGLKFYGSSLAWKRDTYMFVVVPWSDVDPSELEEYRTDRDSDDRSKFYRNSNFDHLLWTPPTDWVEVKTWEMQRDIDAANSRGVAA